jgi:hypothetical protein
MAARCRCGRPIELTPTCACLAFRSPLHCLSPLALPLRLRQQYYEQRSATIKALRQSQNPNPYPHKFNVTIGVPAFIEKYDSLCNQPGSRLGDVTVRPSSCGTYRRNEPSSSARDILLTASSVSRRAGERRRPHPQHPRLGQTQVLRPAFGGQARASWCRSQEARSDPALTQTGSSFSSKSVLRLSTRPTRTPLSRTTRSFAGATSSASPARRCGLSRASSRSRPRR